MERRHVDDLTAKEFFQQYAVTHTPVIITGLVEHMTPKSWTLDYIKHVNSNVVCAPHVCINIPHHTGHKLHVHVLDCFTSFMFVCNVQAIGDKCAPLKRMVRESVSWAKLEPAGESRISTFIESLDKSEGMCTCYVSISCMHTLPLCLVGRVQVQCRCTYVLESI